MAEFTQITEYFEAGFSVTEITLELNIERSKVVTYLSLFLNNKNQHHAR